jgi:hypothetical protein
VSRQTLPPEAIRLLAQGENPIFHIQNVKIGPPALPAGRQGGRHPGSFILTDQRLFAYTRRLIRRAALPSGRFGPTPVEPGGTIEDRPAPEFEVITNPDVAVQLIQAARRELAARPDGRVPSILRTGRLPVLTAVQQYDRPVFHIGSRPATRPAGILLGVTSIDVFRKERVESLGQGGWVSRHVLTPLAAKRESTQEIAMEYDPQNAGNPSWEGLVSVLRPRAGAILHRFAELHRAVEVNAGLSGA